MRLLETKMRTEYLFNDEIYSLVYAPDASSRQSDATISPWRHKICIRPQYTVVTMYRASNFNYKPHVAQSVFSYRGVLYSSLERQYDVWCVNNMFWCCLWVVEGKHIFLVRNWWWSFSEQVIRNATFCKHKCWTGKV